MWDVWQRATTRLVRKELWERVLKSLNTAETREGNVRVAEHNGEMESQHITSETKSDAQKYITGVNEAYS